MANIASAEKKNRQRLRHRERNVFHLTTLRTSVKKVRAAIDAKDKKLASTALFDAVSLIDKAAQKGVIKRQNAARKVSRLTQAVNHLSA